MSNLNILPTGEPAPVYTCYAIGDLDGIEKSVDLTEWWSDFKKVEDIETSANNYFYGEEGFDKSPFTIIAITRR